jgi:hypothetical protein
LIESGIVVDKQTLADPGIPLKALNGPFNVIA